MFLSVCCYECLICLVEMEKKTLVTPDISSNIRSCSYRLDNAQKGSFFFKVKTKADID
jgi:hypothetical protein